jgi:hypothetical protein
LARLAVPNVPEVALGPFDPPIARSHTRADPDGHDDVLANGSEVLGNNYIRDVVHRARKLDLLSDPPGKGRAGGQLTPKAIALLND